MTLPPGGNERCPVDVVQFGSRSRYGRWPGSLLVVCLLVVAAVVVMAHSGSHHRSAPAVTVTSVARPILGVRADWELFGLTSSGLVAVQFARGRIVRTAIPQLQSNNPIFLVAGPGETIVRPLANVPGYAVPDGEPARVLTGALSHGGTLLPGPALDQEWLVSDRLTLVGPGGTRVQAHLPGPARLWAQQVPVISDGRGGLVLTGASGSVYDAAPGRLQRIDALPLAVGPRTWLALHCGQASCQNEVISTTTGASRLLPGPPGPAYPWPWQALPGVVSPDSRTAAVIVSSQPGIAARLDLISLSTGAVTEVPVQVGQIALSQSLAWSPDGRWLFVVTARGSLASVDARTGQPRHLSLGLSGLSQIVMRP